MADNTSSGTGGCLCGAVRYRYVGEPSAIGLCQCERCQRQSGSAFLIGVVFRRDAVTIEGRLATYESVVGGKRLWRHFCPVCGSAVSITLDRYPDIRSMMGGTLDDKSKIRPTFSIWCSSGQRWFKLPETIACYPEYPEGTFGS
jgi:hypothetical protein